MNTDHLQLRQDGHIAVLTINRPERRNSLTHELFTDIHHAVRKLAEADEVRALVLRGAGDRAFSSGFDIALLETERPPDIEGRQASDPMRLALESLIHFPYPVIAMMNGAAFGAGYELAICCDMRVGADDIKICMPPAKIGVVYSHQGLQRFIQILGISVVKEMFFTGNVYQGPLLKEKGLVDYLVPRSELEGFTLDLAGKIAKNAPLALKGTKRIFNLLQNALQLEENACQEAGNIIYETVCSEDFREGQRAFLEKRPPRFQGK